MMNLLCVFGFSLLTVTVQLSLRSDGDDGDVPDKVVDPMYEFGGFFELVGKAKAESAAGEQDEQQLIGYGRTSTEQWPTGTWHAPLRPNDTYNGQDAWPLYNTQQCTAGDMEVLNYWALKQAKQKLPQAGRDGDFKTGSCWKNTTTASSMRVAQWAACYQKFYNVTTPCAQCIGSVYNMAKHNMSDNCYKFCHGRPSRRDGSHWCWEDCQQCMWYVGRKLSDCYGEPYDMVCRFSKELGKEGYYEKNGLNPVRR